MGLKLFMGLSLLLINSSWAMEKVSKDPRIKVLDEHIDDIDNRVKRCHIELAQIAAKLLEKGPERIDCRTICGDDWVVLVGKKYILSSPHVMHAPLQKWQKYNCEIFVDWQSDKEIGIRIVPEVLPTLGDHDLEGATWKAVVWLESMAFKKEQDRLRLEAEPILKKRLIDLAFCRANLEKARKEIIEELSKEP